MSTLTPRPRKARRTRDEIDRLLHAYDASGLSQARFARQNQIALTTLHWWLRRRRDHGSGGAHAPALIPVTVRPAVSTILGHIEIALANGRELRVPVDTDAARIATVVAALDS